MFKLIFQKIVAKFVTFMLPRRGQRAIFLTTLFLEISKKSDTHNEILEMLNKQLEIVHDSKALSFPKRLHHVIWKKHPINFRDVKTNEVSHEELIRMAKRIALSYPEWSNYDKLDIVTNEISKVIELSLEQENQHLALA
jgi:hypothetical protein